MCILNMSSEFYFMKNIIPFLFTIYIGNKLRNKEIRRINFFRHFLPKILLIVQQQEFTVYPLSSI